MNTWKLAGVVPLALRRHLLQRRQGDVRRCAGQHIEIVDQQLRGRQGAGCQRKARHPGSIHWVRLVRLVHQIEEGGVQHTGVRKRRHPSCSCWWKADFPRDKSKVSAPSPRRTRNCRASSASRISHHLPARSQGRPYGTTGYRKAVPQSIRASGRSATGACEARCSLGKSREGYGCRESQADGRRARCTGRRACGNIVMALSSPRSRSSIHRTRAASPRSEFKSPARRVGEVSFGCRAQGRRRSSGGKAVDEFIARAQADR